MTIESTDTTNAGATSTETPASTSTAATADTTSTTATDAGAGQGQGEAGTTTDTATATNAEGKAEGDGKEGEQGEKVELHGAPEAYESFALPDGYALEGERLEQTVALFKELNLSQAGAQKAIDAFVKADSENRSVLTDAIEGVRAQRIEQWGEDSRKEYGANYDAIVGDARAGVKWAQEHRPNILKTFEDEGWGNNPDALWVFAKLGELTKGSSMDGASSEQNASGEPLPLEARMYPNMTPKK